MRATLSLFILAALAMAPGAPALAQRHGRRPPAAAPTQPQPDTGELRVRAESYEQVEKGHIEARGLVDLSEPSGIGPTSSLPESAAI